MGRQVGHRQGSRQEGTHLRPDACGQKSLWYVIVINDRETVLIAGGRDQ